MNGGLLGPAMPDLELVSNPHCKFLPANTAAPSVAAASSLTFLESYFKETWFSQSFSPRVAVSAQPPNWNSGLAHSNLGSLVLWHGASVPQRQGNVLFNYQFGFAIRTLRRRCACYLGRRFSGDVCELQP